MERDENMDIDHDFLIELLIDARASLRAHEEFDLDDDFEDALTQLGYNDNRDQ